MKTKEQHSQESISHVINPKQNKARFQFIDKRNSSISQKDMIDAIQMRVDNPNPASSTNVNMVGVTLSEHHVVPYSKLNTFLSKYGNAHSLAAFGQFIPADASVDSDILSRTLISKEAKELLDSGNLSPQE